jgi:hypothetical protein
VILPLGFVSTDDHWFDQPRERPVEREGCDAQPPTHAPEPLRLTLLLQIIEESEMEQILINLVAGALGGVGVGKSSPTFDLGTAGNIISGLVGGGILGQVATLLLPSVIAAAQSGNLSVGGVISQAIAGGAGGAILTALVGVIKNKAAA